MEWIEELLKELEIFEGNYFEFYLKVKEKLNKKQRKALKESLKKLRPRQPPFVQLFCEDVVNYKKVLQPEVADFVITDPPYGRKYLPLYGILSELAHYVLKEGSALIVMTGQSHLPEVIKRLSKKLRYVWTLAYLTPGGQSPFLWHIRCNTFWKPVLVFCKGKCKIDSFGDVIKTSPNNNDKRWHFWGQSEEGFDAIFEKFVFPEQTVVDPFLGGGTTAVVALKRGCNFIGLDKDPSCIEKTIVRLKGCVSSNDLRASLQAVQTHL